ncbi:MAG: hypothetical protein JWQ17_1864 [Tardiphaga sp.]|jgi:hypothetical protein|nr:hypothetical protein [Tardiphaga sp.]
MWGGSPGSPAAERELFFEVSKSNVRQEKTQTGRPENCNLLAAFKSREADDDISILQQLPGSRLYCSASSGERGFGILLK